MSREILIDPMTRLEGHGRIHIFLDDDGGVDRAYLQIPELRGFEKFVQGRRAEDMPQITSRICGVCPMAHHMAATKALDDLYQVDPPPAGRKIRELLYNAFMVEDHALHFFFLGGPDFIVGPDAPRQKRNILGVIDTVGLEIGKEVIGVRKQLRDLVAAVAGKAIHPVFGLPGGVSRSLSGELQQQAAAAAARAVEFSQFALGAFRKTRARQPRLRRAHHLRGLHAPHLLHGPRRRSEQGHLLRRHAQGRRPGRQGAAHVRAEGLPRSCRRARRAVDVHEVLLPEGHRLERASPTAPTAASTASRRWPG